MVLGQSAKEAGLVDEMGTLWDAIEKAAEKAGIGKDSQIESFPERKFSLSDILISERSAKLLNRHLPPIGFSTVPDSTICPNISDGGETFNQTGVFRML